MHGAALNPPTSPRPARRRAALAVVAGVLAAHALLLGGTPTRPGPDSRGDTRQPLRVRQIVVPAATVAPAAATPVAAPLPRRALASRRAPTGDTIEPPADPVPTPAAGAAVAPPTADGEALPTYATRLPPPATLRYALRRGAAQGQAELRWRTADGRYELTLHSVGSGMPPRASASHGSLDAAGIAPERHTESRRGRERHAVNFQHASGRITFSGPGMQVPLLPGAQDRLSWMVQLPAVLEAEPALREPGREVLIFVAGARGDAEVWTFGVRGRDTVDAPAGPVADALHLRREPRRPYDTQVDVWLDPARNHLPVRMLLSTRPGGGETEFVLEQQSHP